MVLHSAIYSTFNGFLSFAEAEITKKSCSGAAWRRGDGGEVEPGRGMAAGRVGMTAAGRLVVCRWSWWWWLVQRQSKIVIAPLLRRGSAAGRVIFAPFRLCTGGGGGSGPEAVSLEGGGRDADGSQADGVAAADGRAIPPYQLRGQGRYVGLVSRNFFLSLGSPCSDVLADNDCVSCCVCVDTE